MSFALYMVGFVIFLAGVIWGAVEAARAARTLPDPFWMGEAQLHAYFAPRPMAREITSFMISLVPP